MRCLLLLAFATVATPGCKSGGNASDCDAAKDIYMRASRKHVTDSLADIPDPAAHARGVKESAAELAWMDAHFVATCRAISADKVPVCVRKANDASRKPDDQPALRGDAECIGLLQRLDEQIFAGKPAETVDEPAPGSAAP